MAENPATWDDLTQDIDRWIAEWTEAQNQGVMGFTLPRYLRERLKGRDARFMGRAYELEEAIKEALPLIRATGSYPNKAHKILIEALASREYQ